MAGFSANVAGSDTAMVKPVGLSPQPVIVVSAAWQPVEASSTPMLLSGLTGRILRGGRYQAIRTMNLKEDELPASKLK